MCAWYHKRLLDPLRFRVTGSCELPCGCWQFSKLVGKASQPLSHLLSPCPATFILFLFFPQNISYSWHTFGLSDWEAKAGGPFLACSAEQVPGGPRLQNETLRRCPPQRKEGRVKNILLRFSFILCSWVFTCMYICMVCVPGDTVGQKTRLGSL